MTLEQRITALAQAIGADVKTLFEGGSSVIAASQAEMEAGTESDLRSMSPLNVAQAIAALASTSGNLDGGNPFSNYGGISSIDAGGV